MYGDIAVVHMKYRWQSIIDRMAKEPYITKDIVIDDLVKNLNYKPKWSFNDTCSVERRYYKSLVFMALLDAIDDYHAFIGMLDVRQDLSNIIDVTNAYDKEKKNIYNEMIKCPECKGHGKFGLTDEDGLRTWGCLACNGSGWIPANPAKCTGFALCQHCTSERHIDYSEHNNDEAFRDYCTARMERVKPPKNTPMWCKKFAPKEKEVTATDGRSGESQEV